MYESSGSLTDKIIETGNGNVYHDMGMFDECIAVVNPSFQGKYCTVFLHQNKMKIINQSETEEQDINNSNNQGEPVENMSNFVKPSVARVWGLADWLHGTDTKFRKSIQSESKED